MDEDAGAVGLADATRASTMMAIAQRRYGQPDVLEYTAVDKPVVGDDDVLVRVHAAAVHPGDYFLMTGVPYVVRLAFGLRRPRNGVRGMDLAGRVEAVGRNVQGLEPGDEVFGWSTTGTLAEYACAPADNFAPKPANLTVEQAAAIPISAFTALQALRDIAKVQPGQTVLVTGASGGVAPSRCRSPRPSAPRSPACAAPATWTWSGCSAPTTSSTTPEQTSPGPDSATRSSSTTWRRSRCRLRDAR
jgi:hypothetical protein